MYIVAIGWLYVVVMMSVTETSFIAGLMTFLFYGLVPLAIFLWLFGTPQRRRSMAAKQNADQPDGTDTKPD
ncbi:MAG: hypothetical protein KKH74_06755 [Gammaproteobacteria bacterium]|jgi:hypothetical protein|nr:hypothetical protein [Gammaproteobacteria bacterium]MBU1732342.1 hypothetical protein [Gammaproteobacteria bacterium]MBU1893912.1 hypothetical protein [Gammaproteobacteria bacterium]